MVDMLVVVVVVVAYMVELHMEQAFASFAFAVEVVDT